MSQEDEFNIRSAASLGLRIDGLEDIRGMLGAAYSLDGLILHESELGPEFFRLGSGVAGELFHTESERFRNSYGIFPSGTSTT